MTALAVLCLGYLFGCLSPSWFLARSRGVDIKSAGNGNAGASNTAMVLGVRYGAAVAVLDVLKSFCAAALAGAFWPGSCSAALAGAGAVLGHVLPFWMASRGGKGFAPYVGLVLALDWRLFLALMGLSVVFVLAGDKIVFATGTFVAGCPAGLAVLGVPVVAILPAALASVLVVAVHAGNIRNILHGTEPSVRAVLFRKK